LGITRSGRRGIERQELHRRISPSLLFRTGPAASAICAISLNFSSDFASIWRILSRVTPNLLPVARPSAKIKAPEMHLLNFPGQSRRLIQSYFPTGGIAPFIKTIAKFADFG